MKSTTHTPTTGTTGQANDNVQRLEQQLERAHQTAALGEHLFAIAQAHTPVLGLHQQARTSFAFQHGQSHRAKTIVEAVAPGEVSITARRMTTAQAEAVLAKLLPSHALPTRMDGPTKADRAKWAEGAADTYAAAMAGETFRSGGSGERSYVLSDLLASMMHLAAAEGLDWTEIVTRATMHWHAEVDEERDSESTVERQSTEHGLARSLTQQQYTHDRALLVTRKTAWEFEIARIISTECTNEYAGLNEKHDAVYDLQVMINDLDDRWQRRNWTATDYAAYALSSSNVD